MISTLRLTRDDTEIHVERALYHNMISSLLYLTVSRPVISFVVGMCARFQANSKVSHLNTIKHIIKYISGSCEYSVWYSSDSNISILVFLDAEWAGNMECRKCTLGGISTWEVIW